MAFRMEVKGVASIKKTFRSLRQDTENSVNKYLKLAAIEIHSNAVKGIRKVSIGKTEIRYKPRRTVRVSKVGDAPNTDTGRAIISIFFKVLADKLSAIIGTKLNYLALHETRTINEGKRPWLSLAIKQFRKKKSWRDKLKLELIKTEVEK